MHTLVNKNTPAWFRQSLTYRVDEYFDPGLGMVTPTLGVVDMWHRLIGNLTRKVISIKTR